MTACRPLSVLRLLLFVAALTGVVAQADAQQRKPRVPPGRDPGGPVVALLSTGIDYTVPEIAARLARDGEGDIMGVDLPDGDNRPYAPPGGSEKHPEWGDGTAYARVLADMGVRIVPVRVDPEDAASIARGLAFVAQTPARVVVVPALEGSPAGWELFAKVAGQMPDVLIVTPARAPPPGMDPSGPWPAGLGLASALAVSAETDAPPPGGQEPTLLVREPPGAWPRSSIGHPSAAAAAHAGAVIAICIMASNSNETSADLKLRLIDEAQKAAGTGRPYLQKCVLPASGN